MFNFFSVAAGSKLLVLYDICINHLICENFELKIQWLSDVGAGGYSLIWSEQVHVFLANGSH